MGEIRPGDPRRNESETADHDGDALPQGMAGSRFGRLYALTCQWSAPLPSSSRVSHPGCAEALAQDLARLTETPPHYRL
jgi:hypothetical protein